jgi:hypothetical protein
MNKTVDDQSAGREPSAVPPIVDGLAPGESVTILGITYTAPADDGPGRDQHGRHDAPTLAQRMAETPVGPRGAEHILDDGMVGPAYRVEPLDEIRQYERQIAGEPLDVIISRIIRRRDVGAMSHEQAVKEIMAAFAAAQGDRWLIWSNQHGMWWRAHGVGYTGQIEEAGRYSRREAERHVAQATLDGQLTHRRIDPITGREYSAVDEVMVPTPYGAAYAEGATVSAAELTAERFGRTGAQA